MKLDEHLEVLYECIAHCFRPDDENSSYEYEVSRAPLREIEWFLQYQLPDAFDAIERQHGCVSNYFYHIIEDNSREGNRVLSEFKKATNMLVATDLFEYEGYESIVLLELPDLPGTTNYIPEIDDRLETELFKLYKDKALKNICRRRLDLRDRLDRMVNRVWPNQDLNVVIFGSSANRLGTNNGDVDLCITEPRDRPRNRNRGQNYDNLYDMHFLRRELLNIGMQDVIAIQNSTVPICKFFDPVTGLRGDINANSKLGIINTRLIKQYIELDKRVGPFLFAIKYFANSKGINDSPGGTISSYAYYLLGLHYLMAVIPKPIIYSLQGFHSCSWTHWCNYYKSSKKIEGSDVRYHDCLEMMENGKYYSPYSRQLTHTIKISDNCDSLGTLIRGFFKYCANAGMTTPSSIINSDGQPIYPKNYRSGWMDSSLIIQDPFIRGKNVARPCNELGLQRIIQEFSKASSRLNHHTFQQICQLA